MDSLQNYYDVITECWKYFKKFYTQYDAGQALAEFKDCQEAFEKKFKAKKYGPRVYDFAMRMKRRCEEELQDEDKGSDLAMYEFAMDLLKIIWQECGEIHEVRCSIEDE